jgi:AcrR family transcriptional regulator
VPRPPRSPGRTGRPPVTSRAEILAAARALIDRDGWETLTVRRLAAELGIGATTLYHHVRDRDELVLLLLNAYVEQIPVPDLPHPPRDRIVAAGIAMHDALAAWPWAAEVLTVDGFVGRLSTSSLKLVEAIVDAAIEHGRTTEQAVDLFRSIWYYTVGEILVRAHSAGRATANGDAFLGSVDASQVPRLAALGADWPQLAARDTYPQGLRAFVDGLLAQTSQRGR